MTDSSWGWVDQLQLRNIESAGVRNRLAYIATITTIVQISIVEAESLWDESRNDGQDIRLAEIEERLFKTEHPESSLSSILLAGLLSASMAIPLNWLIAEFAATAFVTLKTLPLRRISWKSSFGNKSYKDHAIGPAKIKAWEQDRKKFIKNLNKKLRSGEEAKALKEGHTVDIAGSLILILLNNAIKRDRTQKTTSAKGEKKNTKVEKKNMKPNEFWNELKHMTTKMQSTVTRHAQDVIWMENHDIPLLNKDEDIEFLMKPSRRMLPTQAKWLTVELDKILQIEEEWEELDTTHFENLANTRLSHIWLFEYISMFVTPEVKIEADYYSRLKPGEYTPYKGKGAYYRIIPYKVDRKWFTIKVHWKNEPQDTGKIKGILLNLRQGPNFEETYLEIAQRKVSVKADVKRKDEANISNIVGDIFYDSPTLKNAQLDYAYIMLSIDIFKFRTTENRNLFNKLFTEISVQRGLNNIWKSWFS